MQRRIAWSLGVIALALVAAATRTSGQGGQYRLLTEIPIGGDEKTFWDYASLDSAARRLYVTANTKVVVIDVDTNKIVGETKDTDWVHGFAALVPVGDFQGGDLLMRELSLRVEAPSGSVQFMRGRNVYHSTDKWTGTRYVVVAVTGQAVKNLGEDMMNGISDGKPKPRGTKREHGDGDDSGVKATRSKKGKGRA